MAGGTTLRDEPIAAGATSTPSPTETERSGAPPDGPPAARTGTATGAPPAARPAPVAAVTRHGAGPSGRPSRIARQLVRELGAALAGSRLALALDDGAADIQVMAPPPGMARVVIHGPDALGRLLWPPTPDALAEGYLRGDLDIEGDVGIAIDAGQALDLARLDWTARRRLIRWGLELRRGTAAGPSLARASRLRGPRHSRARDLEAVRFHYDVGNEFFGLWLDRRLTYSCAYFASPEQPLDEAQEAKLDLIGRKLGLRPGQRLLDIGCGWGSLIGRAAERFGVRAVGVTLSQKQADHALALAAEHGWSASAEVRDYRDLADLGTFDAVASVGMFEHVGRANLPAYFRAAFAATRPGGRFLNHGIASPGAGRSGERGRFVDRYVFPDGELVPVDVAIRAAREAGFEVVDLQSLRPHYALTLAAWVRGLEAHWAEALAAAGPEVARTWRLYMSAARLGFERGDLEVYQLLLARPADDGPAERPLRPWW